MEGALGAAFNPQGRATCARWNELMAASEKDLAAQRVCVLKTSLFSCAVAAPLGGRRVKVKCRGRTSTLMKSEVCNVPAGGGELDLIEPTSDLVYEADEVLRFELRGAHRFWSSTLLAAGSLSLATVLGTVGLEGDTGSWTVELMSKDGRALGSLQVSIRCRIGSLSRFGGIAAVKACALPVRPDVNPVSISSQHVGHVVLERARKYCDGCWAARDHLQVALGKATTLAKPSNPKKPVSHCDGDGKTVTI